MVAGDAPTLDLDEEIRLQKLLLEAIRGGFLNSAHDISEGGAAICLAEMSIASKGLGAYIDHNNASDTGFLFGESNSRVIVTALKSGLFEFEKLCEQYGVLYWKIGEVVSNKFKIEGAIDTDWSNIKKVYENALPDIMNTV